MIIRLSCTPFEALPPKVLEGVIRSIKYAADNWGVACSVEPDLSCRDAEMRFGALMNLANERRDEEGG